MTPPFPAAPYQDWHVSVSWASVKYGVHYLGQPVTITYGVATGQLPPDAYEVWDWWGNIIESGSPGHGSTALTTSFACGWYRFKMTGPNTDSVFGNSYTASNFIVIPSDARLPTITPSTPGNGSPGHHNSPMDFGSRACLGLGTARMTLEKAENVNGGSTDRLTDAVLDAPYALLWSQPAADDQVDPVRATREPWIQFPERAFDRIALANTPGGGEYVTLYNRDPVTYDSTKLFVSVGSGSVSGDKVTVYYPNTSTVVETWDNQANADAAYAAINAGSTYLVAASYHAGSRAATLSASAVGDGRFDGVKQTAQTLYPLGIHWFEGPINEPNPDSTLGEKMRVFAAAVKAGNPDAKVMGPATVVIHGGWDTVVSSGCLDHVDGISFHDYNTVVNGDFNQGRTDIEGFLKHLKDGGYDHLPLWQTEAGWCEISNGGVLHPRKARIPIIHALLWEQYGLPRERNNWWYDVSHGFWGVSSWLWNQDDGCNPQVPLFTILHLETEGKKFRHRIDFGSSAGNALFLGSIYSQRADTPSPSCVVLASDSALPGATVDLTITGTTSAITVCDAWGNTSTISQSSGRITVPVEDGLPVYVRLPAGVTASVYQILDWGVAPPPSVSSQAIATLGGINAPALNDDGYLTTYQGFRSGIGMAYSSVNVPDDAELIWATDATFQYLVAVCGPVHEKATALVAFTVDTWDGATWTTQATVTKATPVSVPFVTGFLESGCTRESWWDEQWKFPIDLGSPVTALGVRIHATATSYGVAPDAAAQAAGDRNAATSQQVVLQEILVLSDSTFTLPNDYDTEVLADTPVAFWKLNEAAGATTFADSSGSGLTGTVTNDATFGEPGGLTDGQTSVFTGGTFPELSVPNNSLLNLGDGPFTVEMLVVQTPGIGSTQALLARGASGSTTGYGIMLTASKFIQLGKPGLATVATSLVPLNSGWNHVVVQKNGTAAKIYINGSDVTGAITNTTFGNPGGTALTIGSSGGSLGATSGFFAKVALYNTILSAGRIQTHYQAGNKTVTPASITAPVLAGIGRSGVQVSCTPGTWSNRPTSINYQWKQDGSDITVATSNLYLIAAGDVGHTLTCAVTASNLAGSLTITTSGITVTRPRQTIGALSL